ncbi:hypothetical protein N7540_006919 [Penicillium herquei]|nr:hypothetical protein N7540_006919 [Penicillium herquei]
MPGTRSKDTSIVSRSKKSEETTAPPADNAQDIFRKYFEAQFQPLDLPSKSADDSDSNDDADEDDEDFEEDEDSNSENEDWDGVSDEDEDMPQVEVVEHKDAQMTDEMMDKKARKAFLSGKLPSLDAPNKKPEQPVTKEEQQDDAVNLKHDLALQRLLRESHLLEDASDLDPTGKNRLKALDLRMQSLGAKTSLYSQKMPSSHRKGIKAKAASKESKRRLEAKENGIILERPSKVTKSSSGSGKRDRGIGGSSIGKFSGGTLNLSKQDLHSMKSAPSRSGRGGRGGRGGGRGGRGGKRGRG